MNLRERLGLVGLRSETSLYRYKTQEQADALYEGIKDASSNVRLLDARSTVFSGGVIIATAHLAKGLEFDRVIVPHCTAANYCTLVDRHMLYAACTRAMHQLSLTYTGNLSAFLNGAMAASAKS